MSKHGGDTSIDLGLPRGNTAIGLGLPGGDTAIGLGLPGRDTAIGLGLLSFPSICGIQSSTAAPLLGFSRGQLLTEGSGRFHHRPASNPLSAWTAQ